MTDPGDNIAELAAVPEIAAPVAVQGVVAFIANVREGWRLACMFRPNSDALRFSWGQILALLALDSLLGFAAQVAYVGLEGRFRPDALPDSLFVVPELILAWLLGRLGGKRPDVAGTERYLVALFALGVPVSIAYFFLFLAWPSLQPQLNAWQQWGLGYLPMAWYILAAAFAAVRIFGLHGSRAVAAVLVAVVLLLMPQFVTDNDRWLWTPQPSADDTTLSTEDYFAPVREDNIYRQQQLLADTLAQLQSGRPGNVDLYFVGAAGYAPQDVFMKEVNSVSSLFDERFGTAGRSLRLINNADTIKDVPIASKTSLQQAFGRIAGLMDRDEDILFLFMTSHGSHDHKFSLNFGMMRFNDIDPQVLRKLLDDAGIKRRVIVVSACYSGGFVDALKSDDTLVITAAAADKNSFGCDNENDYTYFGKAYFDEALRSKTWSFVEAFNLAKPVIAAREKQEDYTPSDPQISLGKDIAPVLEAYAREREAAQRSKQAEAAKH